MRVEDLLPRLNKVECDGDGKWKACCPAHDDHNPSMSVKVADGGKILLKCHAGCSFDSIVSALGIKPADLMGDHPPRIEAKKRGGKKLGKEVAHYNYQNESGEITFRVVRYEPKDFRQQCPDPNDPEKWTWGVSSKGVKYVPYRLPKILAKCAAGGVVLISEGEKDVEALESIGFTATCNPGGAGNGKWLPYFGAYFRGAKLCVIIADKDAGQDPAHPDKEFWQGQRHAWRIACNLREYGIAIRLMVLPDRQDAAGACVRVKDAADWIKSGGTFEELANLITHAPAWPEEWAFVDDTPAQKEAGAASTSARATTKNDVPPCNPQKAQKIEVAFQGVDIILKSEWKLHRMMGHALATFSVDEFGEAKKIPAQTKRKLFSFIAVEWFKRRGRFYHNSERPCWETNMFFDEHEKLLWIIADNAFHSWFALESGMNRSGDDFKHVMADIHDQALSGEGSVGIVPSAFFEHRNGAIYISNGESAMVRILPGKVERVDNGTDGVLFCGEKQVLAPWKLLEGPGLDPFKTCKLFSGASVCSDYGAEILKLWFMWLPSCQKTKPPLLLVGDPGSGKTKIAKGIFWLLGIPDRLTGLKSDTKGEECFWMSACEPGIYGLDNVDKNIRWLPDALASVTTGVGNLARKMYEENEKRNTPRSAIVITSVTATFAGDPAVANRLLIVRFKKRGKDAGTDDAALEDDVVANRDAGLTWLVKSLSAALSDDGDLKPGSNYRHPDFAKFAMRCARAIGIEAEAERALSSAEADKLRILFEKDEFGQYVLRLMREIPEFDGTITQLIETIAEKIEIFTGKERDYWTPKRASNSIRDRINEYEEYFNLKTRPLNGRTVYTLTRSPSGEVASNANFSLEGENSLPTDIKIPPSIPLNHLESDSDWEVDREIDINLEDLR